MLNLVAVDRAAQGRGLSVEKLCLGTVDGDGLRCLSEVQGDVDGIGLFRGDVDIVQGLGFESGRGHGHIEHVRRQRVESVNTCAGAGRGEGVIGAGVGQCDGGTRDDRAGPGPSPFPG